ncbi:MAG: DUF5591 domain-containing protein [Candidatus Aenigmatarchaeota archaeon]
MDKIIYLNSGKCGWGKCIFCGWGAKETRVKTLHELKKMIDDVFLTESFDRLKVFNSGSFLDERQIPRAFRSYLVRKCEQNGVKELIVESRGEYLTQQFADDMKSDKVKVTIGYGLEVADDEMLKKLQKGTTVADFIKASEFLHKNGFGMRAYVLVNAPYTTRESLRKTMNVAMEHADSICLLNWFPHGASKAFQLWIEGKWKPLTEEQFRDWTEEFTDKKVEKYFEEFVFTPRWPMELQTPIAGATEKELTHPYYEVWQQYINGFWKPTGGKDVLLFIPCAFRKPYFSSRLHKAIFSVIEKLPIFQRLQICAISSPGVIPYEFANCYPFNSYDWPEWEETDAIKERYTEVTEKRIEQFLEAHGKSWKRVYCYFKPTSESYQALKQAANKLHIKLISCLKDETFEALKDEKNPLSLPAALEDLRITLSAS